MQTPGQYPKTVYVTLFGKALENVKVQPNADYDVDVDISSRDYTSPTTGKTSWFTEVSAYAARPLNQQQAYQTPPPPQSPTPTLDNLGVQGYQKPQATGPAPQGDDLPF